MTRSPAAAGTGGSSGGGSGSGGSSDFDAGTGGSDPSAAQRPVRSEPSSGPLVKFLDSFTNDKGTAMGRMRQVLIGALGAGFLTAAGFVTATWRARHGSSPRAHGEQIQDIDPDA